MSEQKQMTMEPRRELLNEMGYEDLVVFEHPSYDSAIIGVNSDYTRAVYSFEKMVECLMKEDGMEYEEAVEFIEYNTLRALPYFPNGPIVVYGIEDYLDEVPEKKKFDVKKVHEDLIKWIRDWFDNNGKDCNAVLGLSGGKDSTICAALLAEALGKDRVIGVAMPEYEQGLNGADKVAEYLGIKFMEAPVWPMINRFYIKPLHDFNGEKFHWSQQTQQNIPPRIRMTMLYAIAQTFNGRVCCCDNASENYIGYSTFGGDDLGAFSPLGELTVTEVRALGKELGLPDEFVFKTPDDGLPKSKPDEEKFGFSYDVLDKYIREGVCEDNAVREKIDSMHGKSQFKRNIIKVPVFNPWQ